ncbi:MAG: YhcH/YjgK/YiaL family protein [Lachnospiraceae bacterium]|nr:YhcH/YjgK/YiaL family protein [Lachnospiraceae bacterium]
MIIDTLENLHLYEKDYPFLKEVREFLAKGEPDLEKGGHVVSPTLRYNAAWYKTSKTKDEYEIHHREADVHVMMDGVEVMKAASRALNEQAGPYDEAGDCALVKGPECMSMVLSRGVFAVFLPGEPHMPGVAFEEELDIKKMIFKAEC